MRLDYSSDSNRINRSMPLDAPKILNPHARTKPKLKTLNPRVLNPKPVEGVGFRVEANKLTGS